MVSLIALVLVSGNELHYLRDFLFDNDPKASISKQIQKEPFLVAGMSSDPKVRKALAEKAFDIEVDLAEKEAVLPDSEATRQKKAQLSNRIALIAKQIAPFEERLKSYPTVDARAQGVREAAKEYFKPETTPVRRGVLSYFVKGPASFLLQKTLLSIEAQGFANVDRYGVYTWSTSPKGRQLRSSLTAEDFRDYSDTWIQLKQIFSTDSRPSGRFDFPWQGFYKRLDAMTSSTEPLTAICKYRGFYDMFTFGVEVYRGNQLLDEDFEVIKLEPGKVDLRPEQQDLVAKVETLLTKQTDTYSEIMAGEREYFPREELLKEGDKTLVKQWAKDRIDPLAISWQPVADAIAETTRKPVFCYVPDSIADKKFRPREMLRTALESNSIELLDMPEGIILRPTDPEETRFKRLDRNAMWAFVDQNLSRSRSSLRAETLFAYNAGRSTSGSNIARGVRLLLGKTRPMRDFAPMNYWLSAALGSVPDVVFDRTINGQALSRKDLSSGGRHFFDDWLISSYKPEPRGLDFEPSGLGGSGLDKCHAQFEVKVQTAVASGKLGIAYLPTPIDLLAETLVGSDMGVDKLEGNFHAYSHRQLWDFAVVLGAKSSEPEEVGPPELESTGDFGRYADWPADLRQKLADEIERVRKASGDNR